MKTLVLSMISIAATVAAMTACTSESDLIDEVDPIVNTKVPIEFKSSIATVTTKALKEGKTFSENDEIGVFGYKGDAAPTDFTTAFLTNATFKYADNKFATTDADGFWDRGKKHYFYAYYPVATATADGTGYIYTAGTASQAPTVKVTCQESSGVEQDLMWAQPNPNTGIEFSSVSSGNISLPFEHKLSRIAFLIKADANVPTSILSKIEFKVNKKDATLNLITGALTPGTDVTVGSEILLSKSVPDISITADGIDADKFSPMIINGSKISDLKITVNGTKYPVTISQQPTFEEGKITTLNITITAAGLVFDSSITEWGNSTSDGTGTI